MDKPIKTGQGLLAIMHKKPASTYTTFSIDNLEKAIKQIDKEEEKRRKENKEAAEKNVEFFLHLSTKAVQENFTKDEIWILFLLCMQASKGIIYTGHDGVRVLEKASSYLNDTIKGEDSFYMATLTLKIEHCLNN